MKILFGLCRDGRLVHPEWERARGETSEGDCRF